MPDQSETFDLGAIKEMVEHHPLSQGLTGSDVDWFMRDVLDLQISSTGVNSATTSTTPSKTSSGTDVSQTQKENKNDERSDSPKSESPTAGAAPPSPKSIPVQPPIQPQRTPRRYSNSSASSVASSPGKSLGGGGFFHKLKEKFRRESVSEDNLLSRVPTNGSVDPLTRTGSINGSSRSRSNSTHKPDSTHTPLFPPKEPSECSLEDYVKFYKQKDIRRGSVLRRSSVVSETGPYDNPDANAYQNINPFDNYNMDDKDSKFSKLWHRTLVSEKHHEPSKDLNLPSAMADLQPADKSIEDVEVLPSFRNLKPLKRVAFHSSTFLINPPQQIPSRHPRKGNVEVLSNGAIRVNPLTEEDKEAIEKSQMGQGGGIVVGGSGAVKPGESEHDTHEDHDGNGKVSNGNAADEDKPLGKSAKTDNSTRPYGNNNSEESVVINPPKIDVSSDSDDQPVNTQARKFAIDKPMISHAHLYEAPVKKMALDTLYTRCCHLREILPIPSILKQIPKGSMAPLPLLQLRNPTPTMIEVNTFADFIRIAPVICVSLDGVQLSLEQFKILLSAMSAKKHLEHLSLRNTPIDSDGWSLLCWFLSRNKVIHRLDITQCALLTVNVLRKRKKKTNSELNKFEMELVRMSCNADNRSDMDWELFVATLIARGGIEDLILTGCCITDVKVFEKLITLAVLRKTNRLGLAFNKLTPSHLRIVVDNWMFQDFARGLDLGFNDFSDPSMTAMILDFMKQPGFKQKLQSCSLTFLSMNSTNLSFNEDFKKLLEGLWSRLPQLKYLDLLNNQNLFANLDNAKFILAQLPLFPTLIRLHLQNNNFLERAVLALAEILPFCKNLGYLLLVGNNMELTAGTALLQALKHSHLLINMDMDFEQFPEFFKEKVGLYSMRNMERLLSQKNEMTDLDKGFGDSLTGQLNTILEMKSLRKLDLNSPEVTAFVQRTHQLRLELQGMIDELQKIQLRGELNIEGKETLIRFMFIDSSIEKGLMLIDPSLADDEHPNYKVMHGALESGNSLKEVSEKLLRITSDESSNTTNLAVHENVPQSSSPLAMLRSLLRLNLQSLDRQEGLVHKLSKLHDFHDSKNEYLFPSMMDMSGEEIRNKLPSASYGMDKFIAYLDELKSNGVSLEKLFLRAENDQSYQEKLRREGLEIEDIKKKLLLLSKQDEEFNAEGYNPQETDITEAYDKVLNSLAKREEAKKE